MSYVAIIGGATTLGAAYLKSKGGSADGSGFMGGLGQSQTDASSATYGTTIGDDGWSINFGSGTQVASPTKTTNESYSDPMAQSQPNPLTGLTQRIPEVPSAAGYYTSSAVSDPTTLLLLALGGFVLLRK